MAWMIVGNPITGSYKEFIVILVTKLHLSHHLDIIPSKIVLAGDSAGANLCISLAALAIKYGT